MSLDQLTLSRCTSLVHTRFLVRVQPEVTVPLELVQVTPAVAPAPATGGAPQYESFSLLFHGPAQPLLPQGMQPMEHEQLGRFDLFIVPIGRVPGAIQYQAVFNRLVA